MEAKMDSREARSRWRDVLDRAGAGEAVVVQRHGKPVVAVISIGDYEAVREQLEDLRDLRRAEAVLREIERDPSRLVPFEELDAKYRKLDAEAEDTEDEGDDRPTALPD
ncbi:MAG TPA: type II toxin-antitoxin system Phd/YefM family antitoxin [Anaerolineae bacterium]|nr:type II toxin-antitoxin system Phd/YefM family antitoxin [Anaerolineae bacterium]HOR01056.1 type II toxin-antitoxin system Phd/YefM family antitoxin [Anaerolineae bacterium]HPL27095.1 type II toxin-antitoxin system Phd/YefM family antitoxin [Anaerolineae bacterium]